LIRRAPAAIAACLVLVLIGSAVSGSASAWATPEHQDLGELALAVLANDNRTYASQYMQASDPNGKELRQWFLEGLYDCDRLDLARNHYYDPLTGKGLTEYSSLELCQDLYDDAVRYWKDGDYGRSVYYLGRATHMVQDAAQPYHGHNDPLNGHSEFESWLDAHSGQFVVTSGGLYNYSTNASLFVDKNARAVYNFYADVKGGNASDDSYAQVAAIIEPLAVRSTAGFLAMFARDVSDTAPEFEVQELADDQARLTWQPSTDRDFRCYRVYISEPGRDLDISEADLLKEITDRGNNALTITKLSNYGTYRVQVVTVLANDTLESDILTVKVGTGKLVVVAAVIGVVSIMAIGLTLSQSKGKRRRKQ
jgi:phospholipase C